MEPSSSGRTTKRGRRGTPSRRNGWPGFSAAGRSGSSPSGPGPPAKPIIDMLLVVADSSDEPEYVPPMESSGYVLRIREPDWYQHRLFKGPDANINLHVFSAGCVEIDRMLRFREHLRSCAADRELYARTKHELATRRWSYVQEYADAKTDVVEAIIARAVH